MTEFDLGAFSQRVCGGVDELEAIPEGLASAGSKVLVDAPVRCVFRLSITA